MLAPGSTALASLEEKRFLYRQIVHASKKLYTFWLHGYQLSDGPNRLLWTNLSQVFATRDISASIRKSCAGLYTGDPTGQRTQ